MAKILKENPWWIFSCKSCKSKIQAETTDVRLGSRGANYGGDTAEDVYYVACPKCGKAHDVPDDKLTSKIISALNTK